MNGCNIFETEQRSNFGNKSHSMTLLMKHLFNLITKFIFSLKLSNWKKLKTIKASSQWEFIFYFCLYGSTNQ